MASVLCCPIRYKRPNGWADRAQNWHKYSLGLCDDDMGLGVRVARSLRAQSAIGAAQLSRTSMKCENKREAREHRDGTGQRSRHERKASCINALYFNS
jgi:hypothetical protein